MCDELKEIREVKEQWKRKEMHWEGRIKMVEDKIKIMVIEEDVSKELQVRIKKLKKQEEIRERKEKTNIVIKKG